MCPCPCPFLTLALSPLLSESCIHGSHAKELNFYFAEDKGPFCNFSLIAILANLWVVGSFIRRSMTANQTIGADSKRDITDGKPLFDSPTARVPYQASVLWTSLGQRKLVI